MRLSSPLPHLPAPAFLALLAVVSLAAAPGARGDSIASADGFFPGVHLVGGSGTWRTDAHFFNPSSTRTADVELSWVRAEAGPSDLPKTTRFQLLPRAARTLADVLCDPQSGFSVCDSWGLLRYHASDVSGPLDLLVTSNTYNVAGKVVPGTFGQYSPAQPARKAVALADGGAGELHVTGLPSDASTWVVNAAVMNASGVLLEAGVTLVDGTGQTYGTRVVRVPPLSVVQLGDVFGSAFVAFGPFDPALAPYRLVVFVNSGEGRALAYASITDRRTGDPWLVPGEPAAP